MCASDENQTKMIITKILSGGEAELCKDSGRNKKIPRENYFHPKMVFFVCLRECSAVCSYRALWLTMRVLLLAVEFFRNVECD